MRILFIKLGAIGDVIQAAAAVRIYLEQHPEVRLDWVAGAQLAPFLRDAGIPGEVIEVDETALLTGSLPSRLAALARTAAALAGRNMAYDRVVTAYSDWRYGLLGTGVRTRSRVSFGSAGGRPAPLQHRNRVFEYWRLLSGCDSGSIDIGGALSSLGSSILRSVPAAPFDELPERFVVLVPGGARNVLRSDGLRRWPLENYRVLAERLLSGGQTVVLAGGSGDIRAGEIFSDLPVVNLIGKTSLTGLARLFDRSDVVVAHDCGPMHMASITRTALVALIGPTPPNALLAASRERTVVLHEGNRVACSPCYDGRNYACCARAVCMEALTVERVLEAVNGLLPLG